MPKKPDSVERVKSAASERAVRTGKLAVRGGHLKTKESKDGRELDSLSARITTLEQLLKFAEVDLEQWDVDHYVANKWEVGAKMDDGRIAVEPLFQIKAWLRRKRGWSPSEFREKLVKEMQAYAPRYPKPPKRKAAAGGRMLYEVSIFDHHVGKLAWHRETGDNYDLDIARATYLRAVDDLLSRVSGQNIERILLPVGNDFLHTDNAANTTHAGTPQDCDGRWQKAFIHARRMLVCAIERCVQVAPVDVLVVAGNHDHERMFYLGDSLESWFRNASNVKVDNAPTLRKYYPYGISLLGFTHGNEEKHEDLPGLMADEVPELWAKAKHREVHVGHFHKRKETKWVSTDTHGRTTVRILPSLSAIDAWHKRKGYRAPRGSDAYLWDFERGYSGHFYSPVIE